MARGALRWNRKSGSWASNVDGRARRTTLSAEIQQRRIIEGYDCIILLCMDQKCFESTACGVRWPFPQRFDCKVHPIAHVRFDGRCCCTPDYRYSILPTLHHISTNAQSPCTVDMLNTTPLCKRLSAEDFLRYVESTDTKLADDGQPASRRLR